MSGQKKYWRAGFDVRYPGLISWMSGMVEVKAVEYSRGVVWFYLSNLDKTKVLFRKGLLRGEPVAGFPTQSSELLAVDLTIGPVRRFIDLS